MKVTPADIPLLRLNWVAARTRKRIAGIGSGGEQDDDAAMAGGVMMMMAKLRLQIRHDAAAPGAA
jgi:hypothetical protein